MGYGFKRTVTLDHTKVGTVNNTDQSNFPVLFSGVYSYLATTGNGGRVTNANGYDIIFTSDSAGNNLLSFEIDSYDQSNGTVNFWVKVASVSHTVDTVIYLFYGNSSISTFQGNITDTWSNGFGGVWHLKDGTTLTVTDSTTNANNGTIFGTPTATAAVIDGGYASTGSANYVDVGSGASVQPTSAGTLSIWENTTTFSNWQTLLGDLNTSTDRNGTSFYINNIGQLSFEIADGAAKNTAQDAVNSTAGVTYYLVGTFDGSNLFLYKDGVQTGTTAQSLTPTSGVFSTKIAVDGNKSGAGYYFNGVLDEARISTVARTADWVITEFNNQKTPASFYTLGTETPLGGAGTYRMLLGVGA